jgi:hypothetical protein
MKNFFDQLDTDQTIEIQVDIDPIVDNGIPYMELTINNKTLYADYIDCQLSVTSQIDLLSPVNISVFLKDKIYSQEKETALAISCIKIDGVSLIPNHTECINYINDKNLNNKSFYVGYNGTWTWSIQEPFYRWLHKANGQGWLLYPT